MSWRGSGNYDVAKYLNMVYTLQSEEIAAKYGGLDQDHMLILQEIRTSGNKGLWMRTIKKNTRINGQRLKGTQSSRVQAAHQNA